MFIELLVDEVKSGFVSRYRPCDIPHDAPEPPPPPPVPYFINTEKIISVTGRGAGFSSLFVQDVEFRHYCIAMDYQDLKELLKAGKK